MCLCHKKGACNDKNTRVLKKTVLNQLMSVTHCAKPILELAEGLGEENLQKAFVDSKHPTVSTTTDEFSADMERSVSSAINKNGSQFVGRLNVKAAGWIPQAGIAGNFALAMSKEASELN